MRFTCVSIATLSLLAAALLILPSAQAQSPASPFAGQYAGGWTFAIASGGSCTGFSDLTILPSGKWTAKMVNYTYGVSGYAYGTITNDGESYGTVVWDGRWTFTVRGTYRKHADGSLRGTMAQYDANGLFGSAFVNFPAK
jgi:hypothetical protein